MLFDSENIILITFTPGEGGHAIGQLLSMSPEFHVPTCGTEVMDEFFRTGRAHFNKLFDIKKKQHESDLVWEDVDGFKATLLSQATANNYNESIKYAIPIHAKYGTARTIFKKATMVVIVNGDTHMSARAQYEKIYKEQMPNVDGSSIVWGDVCHSTETSVARQKNVLRTLIASTNHRRKQNSIKRHILEARGDAVYIDRGRLMSEHWADEYSRLCEKLNITPMYRDVEMFLIEYAFNQWKRGDPKCR